jgi:hypothetical protein
MSGILTEVDRLYEGCVTDPHRWHEQAFVDWADTVASGEPLDREAARQVRRIVSVARRLATFWAERDLTAAPDDWRSRVDVALGPRAWRPQLELAEHLLDLSPDEDTFAVVVNLFPLVRNQPFMDGIDYSAWREGRVQS